VHGEKFGHLLGAVQQAGAREDHIEVGEDLLAVHAQHELFEAGQAAAGVDGPHVGADAAPGDEVDGNAFLFQGLDGADVGPAPRRAAAQHQGDGFAARCATWIWCLN
jgi:hypothetical protein